MARLLHLLHQRRHVGRADRRGIRFVEDRDVKQPPVDADILAAVRKWGNRTTTSMVRSILAQQFDMLSISTPWVLRQLKRLECDGKVQRVSTSYVTQFCWSAA